MFTDLDYVDYTAAIVTLDHHKSENAANEDDNVHDDLYAMWFDQLTAAPAASLSSWRPQQHQRHHRVVRDRKSSFFENGATHTCVYSV
jgi:hypothetical protein